MAHVQVSKIEIPVYHPPAEESKECSRARSDTVAIPVHKQRVGIDYKVPGRSVGTTHEVLRTIVSKIAARNVIKLLWLNRRHIQQLQHPTEQDKDDAVYLALKIDEIWRFWHFCGSDWDPLARQAEAEQARAHLEEALHTAGLYARDSGYGDDIFDQQSASFIPQHYMHHDYHGNGNIRYESIGSEATHQTFVDPSISMILFAIFALLAVFGGVGIGYLFGRSKRSIITRRDGYRLSIDNDKDDEIDNPL